MPRDETAVVAATRSCCGVLLAGREEIACSVLQSAVRVTENARPRLVVVVDDDGPMRKALGRLLRAAGFVVALFESAEAFIAAADAAPMCLIVDVHLPGMSGLDLQVRLRDRGSVTPVIVMTARHDVAIRNRAAENGCIAFLRKPFSSQTLFTALSAVAAIDPTTS